MNLIKSYKFGSAVFYYFILLVLLMTLSILQYENLG